MIHFFKVLMGTLAMFGIMGTASAADVPTEIRAFLTTFPPGNDVKPYSEELSSDLRKHAHPTLIAFWQKIGFGSFGNGFLVFFHPREHEMLLARWLLRSEPDPTRIPFARTAFGDLLYFRDLRDRARDEGLPGEWKDGSDVAFLSVHYRYNHVITWSMDDFFAGALQEFLRADQRTFYGLHPKVVEQPLSSPSHCYYFAPALALGGKATKESVKQGECRVHQELLLQLALKRQ